MGYKIMITIARILNIAVSKNEMPFSFYFTHMSLHTSALKVYSENHGSQVHTGRESKVLHFLSAECLKRCTNTASSSGSTDSSVGRASDSRSQGHGFDPHPWCGVVSLSKTHHPDCLVLVKPRKPSQND